MCDVRTKRTWTALLAGALTGALAAACGGGGSGSGGGGVSAPASLGAVTGTSQLARVDMSDASTAFRTGPGPLGFDRVNAVALDPATGDMYGVDSGADAGGSVLLRIDATAGPGGLASQPEVIGAFGDAGSPATLVWHPVERVLYGVLNPPPLLLTGTLLRIDPATGAAEAVGTCAKVSTLAYDPVTDALYGTRADSFWRIATATGDSLELFTESNLLPDVTSLVLDPASGTFRAGAFDPSGPDGPRVLEIDLFGNVDDVAAVGEVLVDLEVDGAGARVGLGSGGSIADLTPGATEYEVAHRGNLGLDLFAFTIDRTDGGYWGIDTEDHLVKFRLDGASRTIGRVDVPTRDLVYNGLTGELWGIGSELIFTSTDSYIYGIDTATAEVTTTPALAQVSIGTRYAYDPTFDVIRAISTFNDVSLILDPLTGTTTLTANAHALDDVLGLTWDVVSRRLVALTAPSFDGVRQLYSWDPNASGQATLEFVTDPLGTGLEPGADPDSYVSSTGRDLLDIRAGTSATLASVRDDYYYAAADVSSRGRVYATTRDEVYAIDPDTGATEFIGGTPDGDRPSGLAWDPENDELGFVIDDEIRWTSPSAPWHSSFQMSLGGRNLDQITFSAERGVFYLVGPDGLFSLARNGSSASYIQISSAAPPDVVKDIAWRSGAVWAATRDDRLFRVDPDSGAWTEVGRTAVELQGLY